MKILIEGKQVWPPLDKKGIRWYRFRKRAGGTLVYTEEHVDDKGQPTGESPTITIEIDQEESEYLTLLLTKDTDSGDLHKREEISKAFRRLDEMGGRQGQKRK